MRHVSSQPVICPWCYRRMKEAKTRPMRQNSFRIPTSTADLAPSFVLWSLVWMIAILQMKDDVRMGNVLSHLEMISSDF